MFFQLNDATGKDSFTLDSRAFLVLGSNQNITSANPTFSTNPTSSTMTSVNVIPTTTIPPSASPAPPPQGLSQAGQVAVGIGVPFSVLCLGLLAFFIFKLRTKKDTGGGSGINEYRSGGGSGIIEYRSELENAAGRTYQDTVMSYGNYGQGPRQELQGK
jgi:hypothetical protein